MIKKIFRDLKEPVITTEIYEECKEYDLKAPKEDRVAFVEKKVQKLPKLNQDVLHYLMVFLSLVISLEEENMVRAGFLLL